MANVIGVLNPAAEAGNAPEGGSLEVLLCGYGAQFPRAYDGIIARVSNTIEADDTGEVAFACYGNDVIIPGGTYYTFTIKDSNGDIVQVNAYVVQENSTYELKDMVPFDPTLTPSPSLPPAIVNQLQIVDPAAPWFQCGMHTAFKMTLTQDVEGAALQPAIPGNLYTFILIQDEVGGRIFIWPNGPPPEIMMNVSQICPAPNSTTIQTFICDDVGILWAISAATWYTP